MVFPQQHRYFITLAFKGTNYSGWQKQENSNTIQEVVEKCLSLLLKQEIQLTGCGRTDTGVHARFFVAHFDSRVSFNSDELDKLRGKLSIFLPPDIQVYEILKVPPELNARFSATKRTYKYVILLEKNPFLNEFALFYKHKINVDLMNEACELLYLYSDFTSFAKNGSNTSNNLCHIFKADWKVYEDYSLLVFTITANRFLRNMVRSIVGTMLDVGRNKISLNDFKVIIEKRHRCLAGESIKAHGLYLWDVEYDNIIFNRKVNCILPFGNIL